ncbi:MAG: EAL domain-containing protein [Chitinispirillales bacterium]|jgi:EAL and modified HD-GYP domain-containing signal transduction protein|nr:EAL domain-containing protein [Chitinispirillales bacterium]
MENQAYLARQPIVDKNGNLFAYELLFRSGLTAQSAQVTGQLQATAKLLENVLNSMGLEKIAGNKKVFINCSRDMLVSGALGMLNKERFVLEILESVSIDNDTIEAVKSAHTSGFEIALDDVIFDAKIMKNVTPVLQYIKYAKVDLMENSAVQRKMAAGFFKAKNVTLLAEKVETESEAKICAKEGYELFQGYFFAKPENMSSNKLDVQMSGILNLLRVIRKNPETDELENQFRIHPEITVNLLRYINSAYIATYHTVSSIRQAITLVGQSNLKRWLTLMLFARTGVDEAANSPLFQNAMQRAMLMEKLAETISCSKGLPEEAFLAGIISRLDALCKTSMDDILNEIDLGENISGALRNGSGVLGKLLKLIQAVETDVQENVDELLNELKLPRDALASSMMEAFSADIRA